MEFARVKYNPEIAGINEQYVQVEQREMNATCLTFQLFFFIVSTTTAKGGGLSLPHLPVLTHRA